MREKLLGNRIGGVRIVPISLKINHIFMVILLVSNFSSNYISLVMNQGELKKYINSLLVRDLKDLHVFMINQYDIYSYTDDLESSVRAIEESARWNLKNRSSLALGMGEDGELLFLSTGEKKLLPGDLEEIRKALILNTDRNGDQGPIEMDLKSGRYIGAFKYNEQWRTYVLRCESEADLYASSRRNFLYISLVILVITLLCLIIGVYILRHVLRFITRIIDKIMEMQHENKMTLIDLDDAGNDDVTYLGMAFNSLSSTIDNLMTIFTKFVARDIALKAYREKEIRLEGNKRYLSVLFTDIRRFTNMTEALGTDIIKLLNLHYDQAIRKIHGRNGDIASIIGDALLAVFGALDIDGESKSLNAVRAGYEILAVASRLREAVGIQAGKIIEMRGELSPDEQRVLDAVMLHVGVGIDGGEVFYGNIGSRERMVNTVIGDTVNSSSRLEGLTRLYDVPLITSRYVKDEVEGETEEFLFLELDRVKVKGKNEGKTIFWPIEKTTAAPEIMDQVGIYRKALSQYYEGDWRESIKSFRRCTLPPASLFLNRLSRKKPPEDWNGVWTMTTK
jgi:adenylate cyclase